MPPKKKSASADFFWLPGVGSNHQSSDSETDALPIWPPGSINNGINIADTFFSVNGIID